MCERCHMSWSNRVLNLGAELFRRANRHIVLKEQVMNYMHCEVYVW